MTLATSLKFSLLMAVMSAALAGCGREAEPEPKRTAQATERGSQSRPSPRTTQTPQAGQGTGEEIARTAQPARLPARTQDAKADLLATCVNHTRHELDDAGGDYRSLGEIGDSGVAACRRATEAFPDSAVAHEHLGRALLAAAYRSPGRSVDELGTVMLGAARAGLLWSQSHAVIFGRSEFDRRTVVERLRAAAAAQPDAPGPRVLLAQTLMVVNAKVIPDLQLHQPAELLESASRMPGGRSMVSAMARHLMSYGLCGRLVSPWLKTVTQPRADRDGEDGCALVLRIAASAGDDIANLELGAMHLRNAHQAGEGRLSRADAVSRFEASKSSAKMYFARVAESNSMLRDTGRQLLKKVDEVQMASARSEELAANILGGLLGLALSSPTRSEAKGSTSSTQEVIDEQAERRRQECADAKARAAFTSPDGSNGDWANRYHAANCY